MLQGARHREGKNLPFVPTVDDLIVNEQDDLKATGGRNSRMKLLEQAVNHSDRQPCSPAWGKRGEIVHRDNCYPGLHDAKASGSACRVPAADLEAIVEGRICAFLRDDAAIFNAAGGAASTVPRCTAFGPRDVDYPSRVVLRLAGHDG